MKTNEAIQQKIDDNQASITINAALELAEGNTIFLSGEEREELIRIALQDIKRSGTDKWQGYSAFKKLKKKLNII